MNNKSNIKGINTEILKKYFKQKCDPGEKENVKNCLSDPKCERQLKYLVREHWNEIEINPPDNYVDSDRILDKIHHILHTKEWEEVQKKSFLRKIYNGFSKIAAILILPILIFSCWFIIGKTSSSEVDKISYAEIFSPPGSRTNFELPDGSTGWLNSGSTLKFPVKFRGSSRKVSLTGEGYFDVIKNSKKPFVVMAGNIEVMALGTRFNVLYYLDDKTIDITLESGKVVINAICKNKKVVRITELEPDQQAVIQKETMKFQKRKVASQNYTAWKQGMLIFRNDPMNDLIKKIERWYNVEITLKDKEIEGYRYRATFEDETLNEVLTLIKLTSPVDFVQAKRVKLPDGRFSKKEITLFIKPGYERSYK